VKLLEIDLDRKHFTWHGQHLSLSGKEITSLKLAMIIGQFNKKNHLASVSIPWKDSSLDGANFESQDLNTKDEMTKSSPPSKCQRRWPAWISPDCLWT
jgi:hypothetical protein